jgi:hypothetical protein
MWKLSGVSLFIVALICVTRAAFSSVGVITLAPGEEISNAAVV